jgi:hypothetical protein
MVKMDFQNAPVQLQPGQVFTQDELFAANHWPGVSLPFRLNHIHHSARGSERL